MFLMAKIISEAVSSGIVSIEEYEEFQQRNVKNHNISAISENLTAMRKQNPRLTECKFWDEFTFALTYIGKSVYGL